MKLKLPNVTLIAVTGVKHGETVSAMFKSMQLVDFASVKLLTNVDINVTGIECINVGGLDSIEAYSKFMVKQLGKYFDTTHCLVIQYDGYVLDADAWDDKFLDFDYIGATWLYKDGRNQGNGGFSLRSKKLQDALANDDKINILHPEDECICRLYRHYLEKNHWIKFASDEVANRFAFELNAPTQPTFGFHSNFHKPFRPHVIIRREGAMGDIVMCEPLIDYYSKKGYQVVLDIPKDTMRLFLYYPHYIKHISEFDTRIKPFKDIDLNMAYEIKPKQLVLKSYYEMAGIEDGEMRNSYLYIYQEPHQKIFQKYILIHNDNTNLPHRNSYGVNWNLVVAHFQKLGYLVLQCGNNPMERIAPHFNCSTLDMLIFLIKGADLVIGLDSGVCQLSVALGTPAVILTGSVDLKLRYVNFEKIGVVQGDCEKEEDKNCYHGSITTVGSKCKYNELLPPCCQHSEFSIIAASNKLLKQ